MFIQQPLVKHKVSASAGHRAVPVQAAANLPISQMRHPFLLPPEKIPAYQKVIYVIFTTRVLSCSTSATGPRSKRTAKAFGD